MTSAAVVAWSLHSSRSITSASARLRPVSEHHPGVSEICASTSGQPVGDAATSSAATPAAVAVSSCPPGIPKARTRYRPGVSASSASALASCRERLLRHDVRGDLWPPTQYGARSSAVTTDGLISKVTSTKRSRLASKSIWQLSQWTRPTAPASCSEVPFTPRHRGQRTSQRRSKRPMLASRREGVEHCSTVGCQSSASSYARSR